jgi:DNA-binding MarR family transcriptional regulator
MFHPNQGKIPVKLWLCPNVLEVYNYCIPQLNGAEDSTLPANRNDVRRFRRVLRQFERTINEQNRVCCSDISMAQCHVLLEIDAAGPTTGSNLSKSLSLDVSTISRTVDALVVSGYVERSENSGDRRSYFLRTTPDGDALCRRINDDADRYYAEAVNRIPEQERPLALRGFELLVAALVEGERTTEQGISGCDCGES